MLNPCLALAARKIPEVAVLRAAVTRVSVFTSGTIASGAVILVAVVTGALVVTSGTLVSGAVES